MAHGHFVWNELNTHDVEAAKRFHAETLGWTFASMTMPHGGTYWLIEADGQQVGGIFPMDGPEFAQLPEHWLTYIDVDDVDARIAKAVDAGATVLRAPFDVPDVGRIAIVRAPGGGVAGWMTPKPRK